MPSLGAAGRRRRRAQRVRARHGDRRLRPRPRPRRRRAPRRRRRPSHRDRRRPSCARATASASRPFVVYPAITHPHKNHRFLLDLLAGPWSDPDLRSCCSAGAGSPRPTSCAAIERLGLGGRVVRPGRVSAADRDGLIAGADALVFPSRVRGLRRAGARGDGARHAGGLQRPGRPARGRRRRRARAARSSRTRGRTRSTRSPRQRDELVAAGRPRAAPFTTAASGCPPRRGVPPVPRRR